MLIHSIGYCFSQYNISKERMSSQRRSWLIVIEWFNENFYCTIAVWHLINIYIYIYIWRFYNLIRGIEVCHTLVKQLYERNHADNIHNKLLPVQTWQSQNWGEIHYIAPWKHRLIMKHILTKDPSSIQGLWAKQQYRLCGCPCGTMHLQKLWKESHWSMELPLAHLHKK